MKRMTKAQQAAAKLVTEHQVKVCQRADKFFTTKPNRMSLMMDLESCEMSGTPLDYEKLLAAPDADFGHDLAGIMRHMDRSHFPGKLGGCFLPRCTRRA